jgi:hypothetical protein
VVGRARAQGLLSAEHFTVDGTLIEAWASLKSFRPKDEHPEDRPPPADRSNPTVNFHGERRSNASHQSTTDPDAGLDHEGQRAGREAELHGPCADGESPRAGRRCHGDTGDRHRRARRGGRDAHDDSDAPPGDARHRQAHDTRGFVTQCRALAVTPHVTQNTKRRRAIDARTTRPRAAPSVSASGSAAKKSPAG